MVSRDGNDPTKGYTIPGLSFEKLSEFDHKNALIRQEHAKENIKRRKIEM